MNPISKAKVKLFASLQRKKYRRLHKLFVVEGIKMCEEVLRSGWEVEAVLVIDTHVDMFSPMYPQIQPGKIYVAPLPDFKRISSLENPEGILAIVNFPFPEFATAINFTSISPHASLWLEHIQDPGNFGTLLRTADWFGIQSIYASQECVDLCNPKYCGAVWGRFFAFL